MALLGRHEHYSSQKRPGRRGGDIATSREIDAEAGQALRGLERRGEITGEDVLTGLHGIRGLVDERYDHLALLGDAWATRHTITFYDALYVVLAVRLDLPLLTGDIRLSKAPGLPCKVELVR